MRNQLSFFRFRFRVFDPILTLIPSDSDSSLSYQDLDFFPKTSTMFSKSYPINHESHLEVGAKSVADFRNKVASGSRLEFGAKSITDFTFAYL